MPNSLLGAPELKVLIDDIYSLLKKMKSDKNHQDKPINQKHSIDNQSNKDKKR